VKGKVWGGLDLPLELAGVDVVVGACGVEWKRRPGAVQDELVGSGGAQRLTEHDSENERQRGTRGSPEFAGAVVGDGGATESNARSLVALWVRGLREKGEGAEGVYIAWSRARITRALIRIEAAN
jgi:hypothetical protein